MASSNDEVTPHPGSGPGDGSPEDIRYRAYVLEKIRLGLASAASEGVIEQEDVEARLSRWLQE